MVATDGAPRRATAVREVDTVAAVAPLPVLLAVGDTEVADAPAAAVADISVAEVVATPGAGVVIPAAVVDTAVAAIDNECVELASCCKRSER